MNVSNLTAVRDAILNEKYPEGVDGFNMEYWLAEVRTCGTVACIGGMAEALGRTDPVAHFDSVKWLGLDHDLADALFYPLLPDENHTCTDKEKAWRSITNQQAVGAINLVLRGGDDEDVEKYWMRILEENFPWE